MLPWGSRPPACVLVGSCPCARVLCSLRSFALLYSTRSLLILFPSSPIPRARCSAFPPFAIPSPAFVSFCLIPLTFYLPPLVFPYPSPLSLLAGGGGVRGGVLFVPFCVKNNAVGALRVLPPGPVPLSLSYSLSVLPLVPLPLPLFPWRPPPAGGKIID